MIDKMLTDLITDLLNALPHSEIELAREVWGNTNTNLVHEKRKKLEDYVNETRRD